MLDDARFYRSLGLSQLPLHGKSPAHGRWKHLTQRHPTDEELVRWFRDTRNNIGIICGPISGVVALDADSPSMAERISRELPPTEMRTRTAKGMHFFYRLAEGQNVPPRVRVNKMMLDVRGEVSYVVAAPSIHPDTGNRYERLGCWDLTKVPYFSPAWILSEEAAPAFLRETVRNPLSYISKIRAVSGAGGSNATFRAACILRDAGFSEAEALAALVEWNQTNTIPPWTVKDLLHKVQGAYARDRVASRENGNAR
jgi:hypothetical protein